MAPFRPDRLGGLIHEYSYAAQPTLRTPHHWDRNEQHFDLRDEAALVSCPTLVLAGEDDPSTTVAGTEELLAALPAELTRLHRFAAAGHGVFRDAPEALELVREFVLADAK